MVAFGYFLSCEEYSPAALLEQAQLAQEAGFEALWISDHFHPWNDAQGQSPLVWSMIGALSQVTDLPITTAVTCPTVRVHPAIIAQAAATSAVLTSGRFNLGLGTGEALNEHILGDVWPESAVRMEMLEEAVAVIRRLWTGEMVSHRGQHYRVDRARLYTVPDTPPPIYVSGFGRRSTELAGRIGDGYMTTQPDADMVALFRERAGASDTAGSAGAAGAGSGSTHKPAQAGFKACYAATTDDAVDLAHHLWANEGLPGELAQELPTPRHFEQASTLVSPESIGRSMACGPDAARHLKAYEPYLSAGFDELYVADIGPHYRDFLRLYGAEVLPELKKKSQQ